MISILLSLLFIGLSAKAQVSPSVTLYPGQSVVLAPYQQTTVSCVSNPAPTDPTNLCKLSGPGIFNHSEYQYRLNQGDVTIQGTDIWNQFLNSISDLRSNQICQFVTANCQMEGPGIFNHSQYQYRISADHVLIYGTDINAEMIQSFKALKELGLCN